MIQLVPQGPEIPDEIEQALRHDNLVFFCGAGISVLNGLPLFDELAKKVCENLGVNIDDEPLLQVAKDRGDYASIFDLLEGDQNFSVKPEILRKKVINILSKHKGKIEIHKSLLELSALSNNKGNRLITTNVDKLFF